MTIEVENNSTSDLNSIEAGRQQVWLGWVLIAFAVLVGFFFAYGSHNQGDAVFRLSRPHDALLLPNLVVPSSAFSYFTAAFLGFLGLRILRKHKAKASYSFSIGIAVVLLVASFVTWSVAGKSILLTGMLSATIANSVPIALGGIAGLLSERVAVMNIAIEGMLLVGAFVGAVVGSLAGGVIGLVAAVLVGGIFGLILALLVVKYRVDQIIAGVAINLFVLGLTSFIYSQVFSEYRYLNNAPIFKALNIPWLSDIPVIGPILFQQDIFVYGVVVIALTSTYYVFHTRSGLRARAVGEHPMAADTAGINVYHVRYMNIMLAGMVAGFGGAWFTLGSVGRFSEGMTNGLGFIGLAAMIFGRWHPLGACAAALAFGFANALQQKLAILNTPIPSEFLGMAPYIATIVIVAGMFGRSRPPAAVGEPFIKE